MISQQMLNLSHVDNREPPDIKVVKLFHDIRIEIAIQKSQKFQLILLRELQAVADVFPGFFR